MPRQVGVIPIAEGTVSMQSRTVNDKKLKHHASRGFLSWAFWESIWVLKESLILCWSMGWGIMWVVRLVRMILFALIMAPTVLKVMWYYMNSPTIFRRVVYRRSMLDGELSDDMGSKNNRAYLDLHFPVHTAEIFRARFQRRNPEKLFPVTRSEVNNIEINAEQLQEEEEEVKPIAQATIIMPHQEAGLLCATYPGRDGDGVGLSGQHLAVSGGAIADSEGGSTMGDPSSSPPLSPTIPLPTAQISPESSTSTHHDEKSHTENGKKTCGSRQTKLVHDANERRSCRDTSQSPGGSLMKPFPVLVCITGGAWIIGAHYWGIPLSRLFADNGYLCVCPDYRNFPQATVSGMVADVTDAIAWVMNNIELYGGDSTQVTLLGQSAGAHLMMQSVVEQVELLAEGKQPKYDPRLLHRVVGLSGIYNLEKIKPTLHARGLHNRVQDLIFESNHRCFSPAQRIEALSTEDFDLYFPNHCSFIHGVKDSSAPWQESDSLAALLQKRYAEPSQAELELRSTNLIPPALAQMVELTSSSPSKKKNGAAMVSKKPSPASSGKASPGKERGGKASLPIKRAGSIVAASKTSPPPPQKPTRTAHLYLMPDATHASPYVDDPIMQRSQVVEIICTLDDNPEPKLGIREAEAYPLVLAVAAKFMAF